MAFDDDLLELAEGPASPRKGNTSGSKKTKRKRPAQELSSESDMEMNSSDEDGPTKEGESYPLEGKYVNSRDRTRIQAMSELDREAVLGERAERQHAVQERLDLRRLVQEKAVRDGDGAASEEEDPSGRSGRERKQTGVTSTKSNALDSLRRKRQKKAAKRDRNGSQSPKGNAGDYSTTEDEEEEEEAEGSESPQPRSGRESKAKAKKAAPKEVVGPSQLREITVTRNQLVKLCAAPWFATWVAGSWVRMFLGLDDKGNQSYRLCEVVKAERHMSKGYTCENVKTDYFLTLRHADAVRDFSMETVSNSPFTDGEFSRLAQTLAGHKMSLPLVKEMDRIKADLSARTEYIMTEEDLSRMLKEKASRTGSAINPNVGKARLLTQRDYARSMGDAAQLAEVDKALLAFGVGTPATPSPASGVAAVETEQERMRKVNERNRASNREEIRRAEGKAQDERRKIAERLAAGQEVKVDASARVKTMTRLKYDRDDSRPSTPLAGTPNNELIEIINPFDPQPSTSALEPVPSPQKSTKFGDMIANIEVDVDLDF